MKQQERIERFLRDSLNEQLSQEARSIVFGVQESADAAANVKSCTNHETQACQTNLSTCYNDIGVCAGSSNIAGCHTPPDFSNMIAPACG